MKKVLQHFHLIGTFLLVKDENFKSQYEIGFPFGKAYWSKGYGQETLYMIEKQLETYGNIEAIKAWCIKENFASIRVFEKAGFSKVEQNEHPQSYLFVKKIKSNTTIK
ncbi:MAG: GNAT family N-acetyltransferase [Chitinophagales bacterium]